MNTLSQLTRPESPLPVRYILEKFQLSRTTLWRWRKMGLPVQQVGDKQFILESDMVAFIDRMNAAPRRPKFAPAS